MTGYFRGGVRHGGRDKTTSQMASTTQTSKTRDVDAGGCSENPSGWHQIGTRRMGLYKLTVQKDGLSSSESPERLDACRSEPAFGTWGKNHDHVGSFRGGVEIASTCCTPQRGDSSTRDTSARVLHRFPSWDRRDLNSVLGRALSARPLSSQCCPSASSSSGLAPCSSSTGCHQVSAPPTCRPAASQLLTGGTQNNCRGSVDPPFSSSTNGAGPPPVLRLCSASVTPTSRGGLYGRVVRASSPNGRDNVRLAACHSEPAVFEQHAASQGNQAARRHVSAAAAVNSRKPCQGLLARDYSMRVGEAASRPASIRHEYRRRSTWDGRSTGRGGNNLLSPEASSSQADDLTLSLLKEHYERVAQARSAGKISLQLPPEVEEARQEADRKRQERFKSKDRDLHESYQSLIDRISKLTPSVDTRLSEEVKNRRLQQLRKIEAVNKQHAEQRRLARKDFKAMKDRLEETAARRAKLAADAKKAELEMQEAAAEKDREKRQLRKDASEHDLYESNERMKQRLKAMSSRVKTRDVAEVDAKINAFKLRLKEEKYRKHATRTQQAIIRELHRRCSTGKISAPKHVADKWFKASFASRLELKNLPLSQH